ncbi:MAG: DeoR/GlpR family DNA-binding transcription regulator [Escherichia coli]|nr:DeoR/GlpR family DNA-binding transcription regulator [Escherichia coli]
MKGYNRLEQIMDYLKSHNLVTVDELVAVTNASPATIRRDLIKLDEQGVISRTHGGVTLNRFSDLHIALFLAEFKQIEVTIIGGRIDDSSQSCIGEHGRKLLQNTWPDVAFLSCNSWDLEKGITAPTEEKAALKRDLIAHASRKILLADSSKYGSWSLFNIAHLNELTEIITDSQLDGQTRRTLASLSTRLIIAD